MAARASPTTLKTADRSSDDRGAGYGKAADGYDPVAQIPLCAKLGPTPTRAGSCICWVRQNGGFQSRPRLRAPAITILAQVPCLYHNPPQESSRKQNFDILRLP